MIEERILSSNSIGGSAPQWTLEDARKLASHIRDMSTEELKRDFVRFDEGRLPENILETLKLICDNKISKEYTMSDCLEVILKALDQCPAGQFSIEFIEFELVPIMTNVLLSKPSEECLQLTLHITQSLFEAASRVLFGHCDMSIVPLLVDFALRKDGDDFVAASALRSLIHFASNNENRRALVAMRPLILSELKLLIIEEHEGGPLTALAVGLISSLCCLSENKYAITAEEVQLLPALWDIAIKRSSAREEEGQEEKKKTQDLRDDDSTTGAINAFCALWQVAITLKDTVSVSAQGQGAGLLSSLVALLKGNDVTLLLRSLRALEKVAANSELKNRLICGDVGLLEILRDIILSAKEDTNTLRVAVAAEVEVAISIIASLSEERFNWLPMAYPSIGLIPALLSAYNPCKTAEESVHTNIQVLTALRNLCNGFENRSRLAAMVLEPFAAIVTSSCSSGEETAHALSILWSLSLTLKDSHQIRLAATESMGLLQSLRSMLVASSVSSDSDVRLQLCSLKALAILCDSCKEDTTGTVYSSALSTEDIGLVPLLLQIFKSQSEDKSKEEVILTSLTVLTRLLPGYTIMKHQTVSVVDDIDFLRSLRILVSEGDKSTRLASLNVLLCIANTIDISAKMLLHEPGLLQSLLSTAEKNEPETSCAAYTVLWSLAVAVKDTTVVVSGIRVRVRGAEASTEEQSFGLLSYMFATMGDGNVPNLQRLTLRALLNALSRSINSLDCTAMMSPEVDVLAHMLSLLDHASAAVSIIALDIILKLCDSSHGKAVNLSEERLGLLLSAIARLLSDADGATNCKAAKALEVLSSSLVTVTEYRSQIASHTLCIAALLGIANRGNGGKSLQNTLEVLWYLAITFGNDVRLGVAGDVGQGALDFMKETVTNEDESRADVLRCSALALQSVCLNSDNDRAAFASDQVGLVPYLVRVLPTIRDVRAKLSLVRAVWYSTRSDTAKKSMSVAGLGMMELLRDFIKEYSECDDLRGAAMAAICNLALLQENRSYLSAKEFGLVEKLRDIVGGESHFCRIGATWILGNLTLAGENRTAFAAPEFGLVPVLRDVLRDDRGDARQKALALLRNFAGAAENRAYLISDELGLLPLMKDIIIDDVGKTRVTTLSFLRNLAVSVQNREIMSSESLGLLSTLTEISQDSSAEGFAQASALIWQLSLFPSREIQWSPMQKLSLLLTDRTTQKEVRKRILETIDPLVHYDAGDAIPAIVNPEAGVIAALVKVVSDDADAQDIRRSAVSCLWSLAENAFEYPTVPGELLRAGSHVAALTILAKAGPDRANWPDKSARGLFSETLTFLMNLASYEIAISPLKESGALDIVPKILMIESNGCQGLKAMFIVAFLVGRDEQSRSTASLLHARPDTIDQLVGVLGEVLDKKNGKDYTFGDFCLRVVLQACLAVSVSDSNKQVLVQGSLPSLLVRTLDLFASNSPRLSTSRGTAGGGGDDAQSAELAIETLMQLSFAFDDDEELRQWLLVPDSGAAAVLHRLTESKDKKISVESLRNVNHLLRRVNGGLCISKRKERKSFSSSSDVAIDGAPSSGPESVSINNHSATAAKPTHVMISYCWNAKAKPELVKLLAEMLRQKGLDVWRDEDGSSIVSPMSEATDEKMAEAVESASVVIVCASKPYKESANCRLEAKYANQRLKKGKLKVMFVMMQQEYTTVSGDDCCDGWLGLMISDALWYPLWDRSQVESTCAKLASVIAGRGSFNHADKQPASLPMLSPPEATDCQPKYSANTSSSSPATTTSEASHSSRTVVETVVRRESSLLRSAAGGGADAVRHIHNFDDNQWALLNECWELIDTPLRAIDPTERQAIVEQLGICKPDELQYCEEEELKQLANMLKPIPRRKFRSLMEQVVSSRKL